MKNLEEQLKRERDNAQHYEARFRTFLKHMLTALEPPFSPDVPENRNWRKKIQAALDYRIPQDDASQDQRPPMPTTNGSSK